MADLHVTKDRIDIIDDYTGENKSIMLDKNTKAVVVSFGADETPVEMASNTSVQSLVTQEVTEQLPALLETALTDYAKKSEIPEVGGGIISIYQGNVRKGKFDVNQNNDDRIDLDAGGSVGSSLPEIIMLEASVESSGPNEWQEDTSSSSTYKYYQDVECTFQGNLTNFVSKSNMIAEPLLYKSYSDVPYGYEEGASKLCPCATVKNVVHNSNTTVFTIRLYSNRDSWGMSPLYIKVENTSTQL